MNHFGLIGSIDSKFRKASFLPSLVLLNSFLRNERNITALPAISAQVMVLFMKPQVMKRYLGEDFPSRPRARVLNALVLELIREARGLSAGTNAKLAKTRYDSCNTQLTLTIYENDGSKYRCSR